MATPGEPTLEILQDVKTAAAERGFSGCPLLRAILVAIDWSPDWAADRRVEERK
jgi:hypothetical protein